MNRSRHGTSGLRPKTDDRLTGARRDNARADPVSDQYGEVAQATEDHRSNRYKQAMSYITAAELIEIVPDLRAMAKAEASDDVRAALIRLADRYAAMGKGAGDADHGAMASAGAG
jgi:hypothetical protein